MDLTDLFIGTVTNQSIPAKVINNGDNINELLSASLQRVRRLFAFVYDATTINEAGIKSNKECFLPRGQVKNTNLLIDGGTVYDQPINDLIKQYDEVRKVSTGQGDDCTTGSLLDYACFKDNYRLIVVDFSKQKALDADP